MTQTGEIDAELRNTVERAFDATSVDVDTVLGSDASPAYRSNDAEAAWTRMHEAAQGREIAVLLEMLEGNWLGGEGRWKAVTFLGYSLRTPEAAREREAILRTLAIEAAVKNRGAVPNDVARVQRAALQAVAESPIDANAKWQAMLDAVQASRSHFGEILDALSSFRPSDRPNPADDQHILLDAMVRSDRIIDLDSIARVVRELDVRSGAPDLRRLLLAATSNLSARVAAILADWGDTEAAFELRRAIHQYSTASDANVDILIDALYRLQGSSCTEFIAETFRAAPPALQEYLLQHSLRGIPSAAIVRTVREVAETTRDVELREAAQVYLQEAPAAALEEAGAPSIGAAPAAAAPVAEESGWQPVLENEAGARPAPVTPPATPAAPVTPASETAATTETAADPWQPTSDDPQAAGGPDDARSGRLGIEAQTLALLREEAEAARLAAEEKAGQPQSGPDPLEFLVRLPQILFALAVIGALLYLVLSMQ